MRWDTTKRATASGRVRRVAAVVLALFVAAAPTPAGAQNMGGGFIEFLFGGARSQPAAAPAPNRRAPAYAAPSRATPDRSTPTRSDPLRIAPSDLRGSVDGGAGVAASSGLTYCVRTCDGYAFPLGSLRSRRDADLHRGACAAACPGARTELFVGSRAGGVASARSIETGMRYAALPTAFLNRRERVAACSCEAARDASAHWSAGDPTLRRGDVVVTPAGALVFDGTALVDFRETRVASTALRGKIDDTLGLTARAERLEAWRRANPQAARAADTARAHAALAQAMAERAAERLSEEEFAAVRADAPSPPPRPVDRTGTGDLVLADVPGFEEVELRLETR